MLGPSRNMIPTAMAKIWLILIILLPLLGIFVNYLLLTHTRTHTAHKICFMHSIKMVCESVFGGRYWADPCVGGCCSDRIFGYTLCFLRTCHECDINELLAYPTGAVTVHREQRVKESEGEGE